MTVPLVVITVFRASAERLSVQASKRPFHRHFWGFCERPETGLGRMQKAPLMPISCGFGRLDVHELQTGAEDPIRQARSARARRRRVLILIPRDWHSPAKSHTATPGVAVTAVGELAVEAGEQRRVLIEHESRAGIDLQRVAPGAAAVDRE